jgi:alpha-tubulin suppressor-like RCC1 family protein
MRHPTFPIAALLLVTLWGCRDEAPSPTEPQSSPSPAVAAAGALTFSQVSAGIEHACGVASDGSAWCWGANQFGELGIPPEDSPFPCSSRPCALRPVAVSGGLRFRQVDAGAQFTCGLTTGDEVFCWGRNDAGQLGIGSTAPYSPSPREVAGGRTYRQVRAGLGAMACAISTARDAFCWGAGDLGNGASGTRRSPVKVSGGLDWLQLAVGAGYVCGISTVNEAWCWGRNGRGQLGNGTTTRSLTPVRSAQGFALAQIDAGGSTTCAVLTDGRAFCWGDAVATGDGRGSGRTLTPRAVAGTRKWDNVTVGSLHACGVTRAGVGLCWGMGVGGALGNGSTADRFTPVRVSGGIDFLAISAGFVFSCGVAEGGQAWCWGDNSNGQLGDGTGVEHLVPVAVAAP